VLNSNKRYIVSDHKEITSIDELEIIWNNTNDAIFLIAPDGSLLKANPAFEEILGYSTVELIGNPHPPILPTLQKQKGFLERMKKGEIIKYHEAQRVTKEGKVIDIVSSYCPVHNHDGELVCTVGMYKDVTKQIEAQRKLRESEEKYRFIADHTSDLIMILDDQKSITYVSPSSEPLLGYSSEECLEKNISAFISEHDILSFMNLVEQLEKTNTVLETELRYKHASGCLIWMELRGSYVVDENKKRTIIVSRDISERKKYEEELRNLAFHDSLTGLPNRYYFNELLKDEMRKSKVHSMEMALMYLDIDSFKQVNDTFGHAGGDAILIEFSRRIQNSIRNKDIVCRLSGDEFVIIVSIPSDEEVVRKIASQIQVELKQPILFENHQIRITASIGISIYNDVELTSEELIKRADNALYEVKENGKNDVTFWCDSFVNK